MAIENRTTRFRSFRHVLVASCLLLVAVAIWSVSHSVNEAREAARRSQCLGHFKQLELALRNYHDIYGSLPPAVINGPDGRPWHSWRVLILPLLEEKSLYDEYRFDEPWNGPHNRLLAEEFPSLRQYRCPSEGPGNSCSYFAVTGQRTLWPPGGSITVTDKDLPDGTSSTLHVVEVSDSGVHWMEPRDLPFDRMNFGINQSTGTGIRSRHPVGANVAFADGQVRTLRPETAPELVKTMLIRDDGGPATAP